MLQLHHFHDTIDRIRGLAMGSCYYCFAKLSHIYEIRITTVEDGDQEIHMCGTCVLTIVNDNATRIVDRPFHCRECVFDVRMHKGIIEHMSTCSCWRCYHMDK